MHSTYERGRAGHRLPGLGRARRRMSALAWVATAPDELGALLPIAPDPPMADACAAGLPHLHGARSNIVPVPA